MRAQIHHRAAARGFRIVPIVRQPAAQSAIVAIAHAQQRNIAQHTAFNGVFDKEIAALQRCGKEMVKITPFSFTARITSSQSAVVRHMHFSVKMCFLACAARTIKSLCMLVVTDA